MNTEIPGQPAMARRSWYLRADVADQLGDAVSDMHFTTRRPRHEVLAAVISVALGHRGEIEAQLKKGGAT